MIEVFKTNVAEAEQAKKCLPFLKTPSRVAG
jgi:hypothetical protein